VVAAVAGLGWAPQPCAVAWAAAEAALRRVALHLVHGFATLPYESGPAGHDLLRVSAQAELDDAVLLAHRTRPGLRVSARLAQQRPDLVLQDESSRAAVVVIGTGNHAVEATEARFGSVVGILITDAACPVVAVPSSGGRRGPRRRSGPNGPNGPGRPTDSTSPNDLNGHDGRAAPVVVATDGSVVSQPAVAFAFDAAARRAVPLTVVHCWPAERAAGRRADAGLEHRMLLAEALAGFAEQYPDVPVTDGGCQGDPAAELARWSRRAGLLVVGTHGRDRWATAVWGSVSRTLVRESACPVAVVRPPAAGR
jgi:nucleotide-binding universal stress UspA family protein